VGFDGTGADLTGLEIDLVSGVHRAGAPCRLRSAWINGIKEFPVHCR